MERQLPKKLRQEVSVARFGKPSRRGYSKSEQKTHQDFFHRTAIGTDQSMMGFNTGVDFPIHENYKDEDQETEDNYNQQNFERFGNA